MPLKKLQTNGETDPRWTKKARGQRAPPRGRELGPLPRNCAEGDFLVEVSTLVGSVRFRGVFNQRLSSSLFRYPPKPRTSTATVCNNTTHILQQQDMGTCSRFKMRCCASVAPIHLPAQRKCVPVERTEPFLSLVNEPRCQTAAHSRTTAVRVLERCTNVSFFLLVHFLSCALSVLFPSMFDKICMCKRHSCYHAVMEVWSTDHVPGTKV